MTRLILHCPEPFEVYEKFSFVDHFKTKIGNQVLFCGQFDVPFVLDDNSTASVFHFNNFAYSRGQLYIQSSRNYFLTLPTDVEVVNMTIGIPVPVPVKDFLNVRLTSLSDECFAHLFFQHQDVSKDLEYLKTVKCQWNELGQKIKEIVTERNFGKFGHSAGILSKPGVIPELKAVDYFFASEDGFLMGRKIMIIVVNSTDQITVTYSGTVKSIQSVPRIPKDLIYRCHKAAMRLGFNLNIRRLIKICLNGGIPVSSFDDFPEFDTTALGNFSKVALCIKADDGFSLPEDLIRQLEDSIDDFKSHVKKSSSEAVFRAMFWDPVFNHMFRSGLKDSSKPFLIVQEWKTRTIFPSLETRKVDLAVLFRPFGFDKDWPILLVEVGKDDFNSSSPHKDFTKLLELLSQTCNRLAHEMVKARRKPENLIIYGIWIGDGAFQFCTAHPVVTKVDMGNGVFKHEIHAHLTFVKHWAFNLSIDPSTLPLCEGLCCIEYNQHSSVHELINNNGMNLGLYPLLSIEEFYNATDIDISEPPEISLRQQQQQPQSIIFNKDFILSYLKKLYMFVDGIKQRIGVLSSEPSVDDHETRDFIKPEDYGALSSSRKSSHQETPKSERVRTNVTNRPSSPLVHHQRYAGTKFSMDELRILKKLTSRPEHFAILYNVEIEDAFDNSVVIHYEFERMSPLMNVRTGDLSYILSEGSAMDNLISCLKFAIDCFFGIFVLHEELNIVHSDISINNIMFGDKTTKTWKLIDFDQSMNVEESLSTVRTAGTAGFVAPEVLLTGIFTKKSDIYSFGKVLTDHVLGIFETRMFGLLITESEDDPHDEISRIRAYALKFWIFATRMVNKNPSVRPTIWESLRFILELCENVSQNEEIDFEVFGASQTQSLIKIDSAEQKRNSNIEDARHNNREDFLLEGTRRLWLSYN